MAKDPKSLSRKGFLKIIAVSGAAGVAAKLGFKFRDQASVTTESRMLMGTTVSITLIGLDQETARMTIQGCLNEMARLESVLSRYQPDSELSWLNSRGYVNDPHPALMEIIQQSLEISRSSKGAFDVTVKPLLDLYQKTSDQGKALTEQGIHSALSHVDYSQIRIDESRVHFAKPGMAITLDGIAKGFIVDQGIEFLRKSGLSHILVEAGGDLFASNYRYNKKPWRIGIRHPRPENGQTFLTSILIKDQAVATSGDYIHTFGDDFTRNHILDPRSGYSPRELSSATILAPNTTLADALGTAVMVLGRDQGLAWIEALEYCEACLVSKDMRITISSGFPNDLFIKDENGEKTATTTAGFGDPPARKTT